MDGTYIGEFRNGWFNGEGIFEYKNGRVLKGVWKNGQFSYKSN